MSTRCSVACDTERGVLFCELVLPDEATVATALEAARNVLQRQLDAAAGPVGTAGAAALAAIDWEHAAVGIFGQVCARGQLLADGDRVELYRPLRLDPRTRRRQRAARSR